MSAMKDFLIGKIEALCAKTGYDFDYLMDLWFECAEEGCSWEFFRDVTLERDW